MPAIMESCSRPHSPGGEPSVPPLETSDTPSRLVARCARSKLYQLARTQIPRLRLRVDVTSSNSAIRSQSVSPLLAPAPPTHLPCGVYKNAPETPSSAAVSKPG